MKILIITDTWHPQINGVVNTLEATIQELRCLGHQVKIIAPDDNSPYIIHPPYCPEVRLEFFGTSRIAPLFHDFSPDIVHIATEGPLGWAARRLCLKRKQAFTTAYHTRFPEFLAARAPRLLSRPISRTTYSVLRRFHAAANTVMVTTKSMQRELTSQKFNHLALWSRGVDTDLFQPYGKTLAAYAHLPRPILLYVGRIAAEKNLPAFLDLKTTGSKVVIGTGPDLDALREKYPRSHFLGSLEGETLARHYAAADLFVFPSTTDTFGLVLLEACAAGLRIAALPALGSSEIFSSPESRAFTVLAPDLQSAVDQALLLPDDPEIPRAFASKYSWKSCTQQFFALAAKHTNTNA